MNKNELLGFYADDELLYFHELRKLKKRVEMCRNIIAKTKNEVSDKIKTDAGWKMAVGNGLNKFDDMDEYCETIISIIEIAEKFGDDTLKG